MSALWALAVILIASGLAKLQSPQETAATFTRLNVPPKLSHPSLVKAFPFLEILLGIALLLPFTVLRPLTALAALALFIAFTWLVVRAKDTGAACGCFGAVSARPISGWTVLRNLILVVLALLGLFEAIITLAVTGVRIAWWPLAGFFTGYVEWSILVTVLVTAAAYLIGRESAPLEETAADGVPVAAASAPPASAPAAPGTPVPSAPAPTVDGEPERHPLPDVILGTGQGFERLKDMAARQSMLLLHVSAGCGACREVMDYLQDKDHRIGPVAVRALKPTYATDSVAPAAVGPLPAEIVLTDPAGKAAHDLGIQRYPSAVLIGTDGLTAGGPVFGAEDVIALIEEVREIMAEAGRLEEQPAAAGETVQGPTA
ncbi:MauE/DoxX family redox-associated membrane protein [Micrococcus luteus]